MEVPQYLNEKTDYKQMLVHKAEIAAERSKPLTLDIKRATVLPRKNQEKSPVWGLGGVIATKPTTVLSRLATRYVLTSSRRSVSTPSWFSGCWPSSSAYTWCRDVYIDRRSCCQKKDKQWWN